MTSRLYITGNSKTITKATAHGRETLRGCKRLCNGLKYIVKFALQPVMKVYSGVRGIVLLFL